MTATALLPRRAPLRPPGQPPRRRPRPGPVQLAARRRRPAAGAQTGYQVVVDIRPRGPPSWDSGQVASADSTDVRYEGRPLGPGGRYSWRVRVWDEDGQASPWSEPAWFEVELDPAGGWARPGSGSGPVREEFPPPAGDGPSDRCGTP